jgi:hypothetical protein
MGISKNSSFYEILRYEKNNSPIKQKAFILFGLQNVVNFFPSLVFNQKFRVFRGSLM